MKINPYESPRAEPPEEADHERATLCRSLAFGAYAGAIAWATAGAICVGLYGFGLATIVMRSPVELAIGSTFFGCFGGGMLGIPAGVLVALCAWHEPPTARNRLVLGCLSLVSGWLLLLVLGIALTEQVWSGYIYIPSFLENSDHLPWLIVSYLLLLVLTLGTATGHWLARRIERFVRPQ